MERISRLAAVVILLIVCSLHLRYIDSPWPHADEAVYANHNSTHFFSLWDDLYQAPQRPLIDSIFTYALVPWQMPTFALPQRIWGIGSWQQRVIPMVFGLLALFILWHMLSSLTSPSVSLFVTVYFAFSYVFFKTLHISRPEPIILFIFFANLWWLISDSDNRLCAVVSGAAFSLCFNFHPNVIIPLGGMLLAVLSWERFDWRSGLFTPRYAWWIIGLIAGVLWYISGVDIEKAVMNLQWAKGVSYSAFPIVQFRWNLSGLVLHMARLLREGPAFHNLLGLSIGLSLVGLRRYPTLSRSRQFIATTNLFLLASYACFAASPTPCYALYVYPWIILSVAGFIIDFAGTPVRFDKIDLLLICCSSLFFMEFAIGSWTDLWLIYPLIWILVDGICKRAVFQIILCFAVLTGMLALHGVPNVFIIKGYLLHSIRYRPIETLMFFIFPAVTIRFVRAGPKEMRINEGALVIYAIVLLSLNAGYELRRCVRLVQQRHMPSDLEMVLTELRQGKKIIGPAELWLFSPSNNFRSDYLLFVRNHLGGNHYSPWRLAQDFKPDMYLLHEEEANKLISDARDTPGLHRIPHLEEQIHLFGNSYRKIIFSEADSG